MDARHRLLFLDFETFYSDEYSLRKIPIPNYILDPRFEVQMCAVKEGAEDAYVIDGPDFPAFLAGCDPAHTTTVTFNALFDNSILAWRYGFVPVRMLDAMGMARALRGHILPSASLERVAETLGVGKKLGTLVKVKGMTRQHIIAAGLWDEFKTYAVQDAELCAKIFFKLYAEFPQSERRLMDLVLRCTVQPRFHGDTELLASHLAEVQLQKSNLLKECGVTVSDLMSSDKFAAALEARGVTVEYKTSATGRQAPAFAKTDQFMADLGDSDDPIVQALVAARLGHKSTLEETRTRKLLSIANLPWPGRCGGTLPIPLRFGGAHTQRLSGDWGMNMQNLPRSVNKASKLRKALKAPAGHKVVTVDLGQIEARLVAWLCGAKGLLQQFADKQDPYAKLAEEIFGYPVNRKVNVIEGFIGKTGILGLGYGCGVDKFFNMVKIMARGMGIDLKGMWTLELAKKAVDTYRRVNRPIQTTWYLLDRVLRTSWLGKTAPYVLGPVTIGHGKVTGPGGVTMSYDNPRYDALTEELYYNYGRLRHKIYGAKLLENIIQFLARIIVMCAALRIADAGYNFVLQAHDELAYIVRDDEVDKVKELVHMEMTRRPSWAPDLPLTADVGVGQSYGEAK
jgi:DNA polymerase